MVYSGFILQQLKPHLRKQYEDAKELLTNNFKRYFEVLRAIDPPCVPFFGKSLVPPNCTNSTRVISPV